MIAIMLKVNTNKLFFFIVFYVLIGCLEANIKKYLIPIKGVTNKALCFLTGIKFYLGKISVKAWL
ncbi:hypothetical protein BKM63_10050 [Flavobacterium johnsoniae]|uniref:Uncharacterized protein n=1 Tax=Flavobacterium johnsoniae TaxID=986 RepID=A0A1J7CK64_FLAJO|nr:hypothetical protein BKM63_10050 [Flavobacterium johnsoniae]